MTCPACSSPAPDSILDVPRTPVFCNVLCRTRDEARAVARADLRLARCGACGLLFNAAFDPALVLYHAVYENALHFSPSFRTYAAELAHRLANDHALNGRTVVEIGCGDGHFLGLLAQHGCRAIGFDPAHDPSRSADGGAPGVTIHSRMFGPADASLKPDLLVCRHVLEHIWQPRAFLAQLRAALAANSAVFFEVPNGRWILDTLAVWDVIYEHCLYFTPASLARIFTAAGFAPQTPRSAYGDQFLTITARPGAAPPIPSGAADEAERQLALRVGQGQRDKVAHWRAALGDLSRNGRRAALWGAGSKGVTFLNTLGNAADTVSCVVDLNPRKQGGFVAGTGHPIVSPADLRSSPPGAVIIMNPIYRDEIAASLRALGLAPEILIA